MTDICIPLHDRRLPQHRPRIPQDPVPVQLDKQPHVVVLTPQDYLTPPQHDGRRGQLGVLMHPMCLDPDDERECTIRMANLRTAAFEPRPPTHLPDKVMQMFAHPPYLQRCDRRNETEPDM